MRLTVTIDDALIARLKAEARRDGRTLNQTIDLVLRRGLRACRVKKPFRVKARSLGLKPGYSLDSVSKLLAQMDRGGI